MLLPSAGINAETMEEEPAKGTVTSLSSLFPVEETQKASQRVHDAITERQKELEQLREFVAENNSLVNLVQKLPEELHHDIMVPFGKAAFFPGRLIHTNEFLVFLGEGYYAERTSKQTTEILKRRGKALESQVESLKAVMKDLKAEASFFEATAAEAAEGLVEIREDYIDDISSQMAPKEGTWRPKTGSTPVADKVKYGAEDEELSRMLSRIDELEKEEEEAERINGWNEEVKSEADSGYDKDQLTLGAKVETSEEHQLNNSPKLSKDESTVKDEFLGEKHVQSDFSKQLKPGGTRKDSLFKEGFLLAKGSVSDKARRTEKGLMLPEAKENNQTAPAPKNEAFTGSVIEHTHNIEMNSGGQTSGPASKPVSRFKMQRK